MESPLAYYQENAQRYQEALVELKQRIAFVALLRLAGFILFAWAGYQWLNGYRTNWLMVSLAGLIAFILFIRMAFRLNDKKALLEKLLFINTNEIDILENRPGKFSDAREFSSNDDFTADLDIFGPGSLYQLLNRTTTYHGTQQLAGLLQKPPLSKETIEARQQAVQTMSEQKEIRQLITAHGLLHEEKEGNLYDVISWLKMPPILERKKLVQVLQVVVPVLNTAAFVYYLITDIYGPLSLGIIISWITIGSMAKHINQQHARIGKKQSILDQYAAVLKYFSQVRTGSSTLLKEQQAHARAAHQTIKKLSSLAAFFDQRINLVVNIFLNSIAMYDIQCLWALEEWKKINKEKFEDWIHCVGTIESLNSLATFAYNYPDYCYPTVDTEHPGITTTQMAHPLIPAHERVVNDFTVGQQEKTVLITGSNMSGKTTFLRAIGVNTILAQCGAPVCAASFSFSPMTIYTSIRVSDSLQEHTSYFMAELKRLQQIIRHLQQTDSITLVLTDEILRGTNSEDKTHGSEQFIKKLLQYKCITLFATHDLTLSALEDELPGKVNNYCFESTIRDGDLLFDYKLHRGVAKNKNASFLMQKMEII